MNTHHGMHTRASKSTRRIDGREHMASAVKPVTVVVASKNPCKVDAVRKAFELALEGVALDLQCAAAPSGVSEQPIGERETLLGVYNRLRGAMAARPEADYWVAIEGGVAPTPVIPAAADEAKEEAKEEVLYSGIAFAGVAVRVGGVARVSVAQTGSFPLPRELGTSIVRDHEEMGPVCDRIFAAHDTKSNLGAIGHLTAGKFPRGPLYVPAVHMALIPFINPTLTFDLPRL